MKPQNIGNYEVEKYRKVEKFKLEQNQYTASLLNETLKLGLLNIKEVSRIQTEVSYILEKLIMRYTKGESTSVTVETTKKLLSSIMYSIDAYMMNYDDVEKSIIDLKTKDIKEIYIKGVELVSLYYEKTMKDYRKIKRNKLNTKLEAYNATIYEAIPLFFRKYEIMFGAHNTMASIDYPLALPVDDIKIRGVFYIKKYLEHLDIETEFCKHFREEDIEEILISFGRNIRMDYKIELINIFELVINNSIFSILSGGKGEEIAISSSQYKFLNEKFDNLMNYDIELLIDQAFQKLINTLKINSFRVLDYINKYKKVLMGRVINGVENKSLDSIVITNKKESIKNNTITFRATEKLRDYEFNMLVKKLIRSISSEDKINMLNTSIKSLHDMIDIFNANCLFENEYIDLFSTLSDMELTILARIAFYEELRGNSINLLDAISCQKEIKDEWQIHYIKFLTKLNKDRIKSIETYLDKIEYEEISFY
ncbi:DUF6179 domain-containing protein [Dethiothermospora halolimnae]|uniref:DUF6179 domain-containing protein n=1 Tax=Dethiothermospora halolimnae TaxID=3114390 RepID=UPI003CCC1465